MAQTKNLSLVEPRESPKMGRIYDALMEGWPNAIRGYYEADRYVCWGIIGDNHLIMHQYPHIFCDMPYWGRYDPDNEDWDNTYWRWCYDGLHDNRRLDVPSDRFDSWGVKVDPWTTGGDDILICPSSNTMTGIMHGMDAGTWVHMVAQGLKERTNRPIRVRYKPRKNGTSGPSVADVPLEEDLQNVHAVVTSASLVSITALQMGIPVFGTAPECPAAWCANYDLDRIENPYKYDREHLFYNLAYKQYSIKEMREGVCYEMSERYLNGSR